MMQVITIGIRKEGKNKGFAFNYKIICIKDLIYYSSTFSTNQFCSILYMCWIRNRSVDDGARGPNSIE